MNRYFSKEAIHVAKKHMKRISTSLGIQETQIKAIMRYHFMPVRMVIIKKLKTTDGGEVAEKKECFYTVGGSVN